MELNREEIVKALECCAKGCCGDCPRSPSSLGCCRKTMLDALSLINELTEEVEDLKAIAEEYRKQFEEARTDVAEEIFAEIERMVDLNTLEGDVFTGRFLDIELEDDIDEIKKKYTGGNDAQE